MPASAQNDYCFDFSGLLQPIIGAMFKRLNIYCFQVSSHTRKILPAPSADAIQPAAMAKEISVDPIEWTPTLFILIDQFGV